MADFMAGLPACGWCGFLVLSGKRCLAERLLTVTMCASGGTGRSTSFGARGARVIARFAILCCIMGWGRLCSKRWWSSAAENRLSARLLPGPGAAPGAWAAQDSDLSH